MIKDIVQYPSALSVEYATDVRTFNENLFALIDDLKDTMKENNLTGLAAFQIGSYYNVVVVKDDNGEFLELINPRLISHNGSVTTEETTAYYPGKTAPIKRYENISIVYQDRDANDKSLKASGDLAITIQRKIDYTFGATFIQRMDKEQKERFELSLEYGVDVGTADYCPTTFKRDKIITVINVGMLIMLVNFIVSFFISDTSLLNTMWEYQLYGSYGVLALNIVYFFYAQYEGKQYTSCTSCQIGNIIGTATISLIKLSILMSLSYFFLPPS
jgi:peptide deformylase